MHRRPASCHAARRQLSCHAATGRSARLITMWERGSGWLMPARRSRSRHWLAPATCSRSPPPPGQERPAPANGRAAPGLVPPEPSPAAARRRNRRGTWPAATATRPVPLLPGRLVTPGDQGGDGGDPESEQREHQPDEEVAGRPVAGQEGHALRGAGGGQVLTVVHQQVGQPPRVGQQCQRHRSQHANNERADERDQDSGHDALPDPGLGQRQGTHRSVAAAPC